LLQNQVNLNMQRSQLCALLLAFAAVAGEAKPAAPQNSSSSITLEWFLLSLKD
jgi:hypothetical protein